MILDVVNSEEEEEGQGNENLSTEIPQPEILDSECFVTDSKDYIIN